MKKPSMKRLIFALACAALAAQAETWDFTKGCPEGFTTRKGAVLNASGLTSSDPWSLSLGSGCVRTQKFLYPEAFRIDVDFVPSAPIGKSKTSVIWDDMYVTYAPGWKHGGIQLVMEHNRENWRPRAYVGLSNRTCAVTGPSVRLEPGRKTRLSFTYDANRRILWKLDGQTSESTLPKSGPVAPGTCNLTIGDRVGGNYQPLDAAIERVSVTAEERQMFGILPYVGRLAFERAEANAKLKLALANFSGAPVTNVKVKGRELTADGTVVASFDIAVDGVPPNGDRAFDVPVETRVRPGDIRFELDIAAQTERGAKTLRHELAARIGPTYYADRMPALMWGFDAPVSTLADFGFTHGLYYSLGWRSFPKEGEDDLTTPVRYLDKALAAGVQIAKSLGVEFPEGKDQKAYCRLDREGNPTGAISSRKSLVPEVSNPDFAKQACKTAAKHCALFGDHPAFGGLLPCSEARDDSCPSFNTEPARYKHDTGKDIPDGVKGHVAHFGQTRKRFPDGIIPEDDPVLSYYRWFWKGGDGWPGYISAIADEYRRGTGNRNGFFSFWDPAVRCPPIWGSGGTVDYLSQWIYAVPEPMNVAASLEEMFAMSAGRPGQDVMIMTQLICYRSQIAPSNVVVNPAPAWLKKRPRAGFPSIPPDSLTEATWSMLAKPVKGVMYHGWGTVYETGSETGYCFTNPKTTERLKELLHDVVAPLGPALRRIGRTDSEFAIFESATTALMGGPASWGWMTPAITFCQRARLDPRIIFEETILRDGFGNAKVVYAPQCMFLTPRIIQKLKEFQAKGGILVGDADMNKALKPDVVVPVVSFKAPPLSDHSADVDAMEAKKTGDTKTREGTMRMKAKMQRDGDDLRKALADKGFRPVADSSSAEIVTYSRRYRDTPYVVAINDKRTFGDYVGQWGCTMEQGLPFEGEVTQSDPNGRVKAVYELSQGGRLGFTRDGDRVAVPISYKTNDGRLLAFLSEPISSVKLATSDDVSKGGRIRIRFSVLGPSGKPVPAVLPVEVRIRDARGQELDGAGFVAAVDGVCELSAKTNLDDADGDYTVFCRDRASGFTASEKVVRGKRLSWWRRMIRKLRGKSI